VLLLFGARRLPEIARSIGRALEAMRRAAREAHDELISVTDDPGNRASRPPEERPSGRENAISSATGADATGADAAGSTPSDASRKEAGDGARD